MWSPQQLLDFWWKAGLCAAPSGDETYPTQSPAFHFLIIYCIISICLKSILKAPPPPSLVFYILAVSIVWDSCQHPHQQQPVLNEDTWASLQDLEEDPAGQYDFTEASRHVEVEKHDSASLFMSKNFS